MKKSNNTSTLGIDGSKHKKLAGGIRSHFAGLLRDVVRVLQQTGRGMLRQRRGVQSRKENPREYAGLTHI